MDFLVIYKEELCALSGLPHIQRLVYLLGIRPYMDVKTGLVGIKRRVSHQSIAEQLYVEPHQGTKSQSFSRDQVRRAISGLVRAGVIEMQSEGMHLILKCELATKAYSVQNKAAINPPQKATINPHEKNLVDTGVSEVGSWNADTVELPKAATPQILNNNICIVLLREKFETFWSTYPQPQNQPKAWDVFQRLNPDDALFNQILAALNAQITHYQQSQEKGLWVPHWKYPANWLLQQSWKDELITYNTTEKPHGNYQRCSSKKSAIDILWESCKSGADYVFPNEQAESPIEGNIIPFPRTNQQ